MAEYRIVCENKTYTIKEIIRTKKGLPYAIKDADFETESLEELTEILKELTKKKIFFIEEMGGVLHYKDEETDDKFFRTFGNPEFF